MPVQVVVTVTSADTGNSGRGTGVVPPLLEHPINKSDAHANAPKEIIDFIVERYLIRLFSYVNLTYNVHAYNE
jgi:hypothetical protein